MKIKDNSRNLVSLTKNSTLWNEVLNSSERNSVLVASAAFDILLERLLKNYLIQDSPISNNICESSVFASKINLCFSLGLISEEEKHDLNLLRDIRNAFAHNIFGCDFKNKQVQTAISNLVLPRKAGAIPDVDFKFYFNIGLVLLDSFLSERITITSPVKKYPNKIFSS